MEYINRICERHNIQVQVEPFLFDNAQVRTSPIGSDERPLIMIGSFVEHKEAVLLHEIGHILHPLGHGLSFTHMTRELAANAWAFNNYQGDNPSELLPTLYRGIRSYLDHGYRKCIFTHELMNAAARLGVLHNIQWLYIPGFYKMDYKGEE